MQRNDLFLKVIYLIADLKSRQKNLSTLKKMETALEGFQTIVRCHKGFIVNLDKIENVEASAQGLKLKLVQCTETVSVGKTFTEIIKRKVQKS